jgi:hypothetical protein
LTNNVRTIARNSVVDSNDHRYDRIRYFSDTYGRKDLFSFFIKPNLKVIFDNQQEPDVNTFAPSHQLISTNDERLYLGQVEKRRFLKVRIKNKGKELAINCEGELRITKWPSTMSLPPSTDIKKLSWDEVPTKSSEQRSIRTKKEGELLNVIFVDSRLEPVTGEEFPIYAYIATPEALTNMYQRAQDGIRSGDYEAELILTSENGAYTKTMVSIHVDKGYNSAIIKELKS